MLGKAFVSRIIQIQDFNELRSFQKYFILMVLKKRLNKIDTKSKIFLLDYEIKNKIV